eukprot:8439719-Alexandrium_andersonii.AAC.1
MCIRDRGCPLFNAHISTRGRLHSPHGRTRGQSALVPAPPVLRLRCTVLHCTPHVALLCRRRTRAQCC